MKFFIIFALLVTTKYSESALKMIDVNKFALSDTMAAIALKNFPEKFSNVRILGSVSKQFQPITNDIITSLIKGLDSNIKVSIWDQKTFKQIPNKSSSLVVIFIDSFQPFEPLREKLLCAGAWFDKFYSLVLVDGIFEKLETVTESF